MDWKHQQMFTIDGKPTPDFFEACKQAILMDPDLKKTTAGRNFFNRTVAKLLKPPYCNLLNSVFLQTPEIEFQVASEGRILCLSKNSVLPTLKSGMFIILSGTFNIKQDW